MHYFKNSRNGLTYLMAAVMTAAPAFHIGDTIEIETLLNGRNKDNFLSDKESIRKYVTAQLPKGTQGEIEAIRKKSPKNGANQGNIGLKIKITSGPKKGGEYWVLWRPDRNYLKLYDKQAHETASLDHAKSVEARREIGAIEASETNDSDAAQGAIDLSESLKDAGSAPKVDCQKEDTSIPQEALPKYEAPKLIPLPQDLSLKFLRDSPKVQTADPQIQAQAQEITKGKTTDFDKAMAIHDWVASNVNYDTDAYLDKKFNNVDYKRKYDALDVLNSGTPRTAICTGYSTLTVALLRASGIPARVQEGLLHYDGPPAGATCDNFDSDNPLAHAWVEAYVNGDWMSMDVTGDAGYFDPKTNTFTSHPSDRFMDSDLFKKSHTGCKVEEYY